MRLSKLICALTALLLASSAGAQTVASLKGKNFSGGRPPHGVENPWGRLAYADCNFSSGSLDFVGGKYVPHVLVFTGTPTFRDCNFTNTRPSAGTLTHCNTTLRRNDVALTTETLPILLSDGETATFSWLGKEDQILGCTDPKTLKPIYKPLPTRLPVVDDDAPAYRSQRVDGKVKVVKVTRADVQRLIDAKAAAAKEETMPTATIGVIAP